MKVALDTNILMDFLFEGRPCHNEAKSVFLGASNGLYDLQITTQSIIDTAYQAKKSGIGFAELKNTLEQIWVYVSIASIDWLDMSWALEHYSGDFEDDMQYASAYSNSCDYFITRDRDLQKLNSPLCPMTVITPQDFVSAMTE